METFFSIQGEGFHSGKSAYFIRIGGCDVGCQELIWLLSLVVSHLCGI